MRELSPFYIPFIPSKCYASLLPSYPPLAKGVLYSNSGLRSNYYWFGVRTTTCLPLETVVVCIQITIGLPANDYWFAPLSHIATQLPPAIFPFYYPAKRTSSPLNSLLLLPGKPPPPYRI